MIDDPILEETREALRRARAERNREPQQNGDAGIPFDAVPPPNGPGDYGLGDQTGDEDHGANGQGCTTGTPPILTLDEWLDRDLPAPDFLLGAWLSTTSRV